MPFAYLNPERIVSVGVRYSCRGAVSEVAHAAQAVIAEIPHLPAATLVHQIQAVHVRDGRTTRGATPFLDHLRVSGRVHVIHHIVSCARTGPGNNLLHTAAV